MSTSPKTPYTGSVAAKDSTMFSSKLKSLFILAKNLPSNSGLFSITSVKMVTVQLV